MCFYPSSRVLQFILFVLSCIDTHRWRKARKAQRNANFGAAHLTLRHGDYAAGSGVRAEYPPPGHGDRFQGKDIELGPTSPTVREFI